MKRTTLWIGAVVGLALSAVVTACQPAPQPVPTLAPAATTAAARVTPLPTAAPTAVPTEAVAAAPEASATPVTGAAEEAAQAYFAALQNRDYQAAGELISRFSLLPDNLTPADATAELQTQMADGQKWSDLRVLGSQALADNDKTALVHVTYQLTTRDAAGKETPTAKDEQWPMRQEGGKWLYNRANLVDYHTLDLAAKTYGGLTIQPRMLLRYTDHMRFGFIGQNATNESITFGQPNEVLAAFVFGDQKVETSTKQLIFYRLRSDLNAAIDVQGWYPSYPQSIEIRRYKNVNQASWFTFQFGE